MDIDGHQRTLQLPGEKADSAGEQWRALQLPRQEREIVLDSSE